MARTRIKDETLASWEEVDGCLKKIGEIDNKLQKIEADMNDEITLAKTKADDKSKLLLEQKKQLELLIKDYAETNRMDLDGKTKAMTFGKLGFRKSTTIIVKKIKNVLVALRAKGMDDCINVKESVNKDALRQYSDDVIAAVGCVKKVDDVFWYEPDYEKLEQ